jgi:hypothetical protein
MSMDFVEPFSFVCSDCGRQIIQISGPRNDFHLCAFCTMMPGWYTVPELRQRFGYEEPGSDGSA